eukprot:GHVT01048676.1.p1 GENE.GHVT01048676.1~~GHVT01048676.1.p1  ORF type:complete len:184 (+),score=27.67 GHVT01048676.1:195-746(+)
MRKASSLLPQFVLPVLLHIFGGEADSKQEATPKKKIKAKKPKHTREKPTKNKPRKKTKKRKSKKNPVDLEKKLAPVQKKKGTDGGISGDGKESSGSYEAPVRSAFFTLPILVPVIVAAVVGPIGVATLAVLLLRRAKKKKISKNKKQLKANAEEGPAPRFTSQANKVSAKASDRLTAEPSLMY